MPCHAFDKQNIPSALDLVPVGFCQTKRNAQTKDWVYWKKSKLTSILFCKSSLTSSKSSSRISLQNNPPNIGAFPLQKIFTFLMQLICSPIMIWNHAINTIPDNDPNWKNIYSEYQSWVDTNLNYSSVAHLVLYLQLCYVNFYFSSAVCIATMLEIYSIGTHYQK